MESLIQMLHSIHPMSEPLRDHLSSILRMQEFPKKEYLLRNGNTSKQIFFIESGLVRCFYVRDRDEISSWFMKEGDVIISVESFFTQQASHENIQAIEDTVVYGIYYQQLQDIYRRYPEFNFIGRVLTEKYYTLSERRLYSMRLQSAEARYSYLLTHHHDIVGRIPVKHLASYLDISRETLSRIRHQKRLKY
jgi:CRP-like cAMP-binding protein